MIEVIEKLKWKDEVLVKIPLLTCSDGYLIKKIDESDIDKAIRSFEDVIVSDIKKRHTFKGE